MLFTLLFGFILVMPNPNYGLVGTIEKNEHDDLSCESAGDNSPLLAHVEGMC